MRSGGYCSEERGPMLLLTTGIMFMKNVLVEGSLESSSSFRVRGLVYCLMVRERRGDFHSPSPSGEEEH